MHGVEHNCLHLLLGSFLLFCLLCLVTRVKLELAWLMPVAYTPTAFPFGASCFGAVFALSSGANFEQRKSDSHENG